MPFETWQTMQFILPTPTTEVLLTSNGKDVLLVDRHDEYWDGWHIPGGFMIAGDSIEKACKSVAKRELGIDIKLIKIIDALAWLNHPYGNPVCNLCHCEYKSKPMVGKFFEKTPKNMVSKEQKWCVDRFLKYLKSKTK